jgi:hypothetical protein
VKLQGALSGLNQYEEAVDMQHIGQNFPTEDDELRNVPQFNPIPEQQPDDKNIQIGKDDDDSYLEDFD